MQLSRCVTDYHVICKSCCKCNFVWRCEKRYTIWFVVVVIKGKKMESKYVCVVLYLVIYGNVRRIKLKIRKFKVTTILILVAFGWIILEDHWIYRWFIFRIYLSYFWYFSIQCLMYIEIINKYWWISVETD